VNERSGKDIYGYNVLSICNLASQIPLCCLLFGRIIEYDIGFVGSGISSSSTLALHQDLEKMTLARLWPYTKHMDRILDNRSIRTSSTSRRQSLCREITCRRQAVLGAGGSMVLCTCLQLSIRTTVEVSPRHGRATHKVIYLMSGS
jgi:hypothetical protein